MEKRSFRRSMTLAEYYLWRHLQNHSLFGNKFMFKRYFVCHEYQLIIEIDRTGSSKKHIDEDERGYRVLHFSNMEIFYDIDVVMKRITANINKEGRI